MPGSLTTPTQSDLLLQRVENLVQDRSTTDRRMGYAWLLVPVLPILVAIALAVSFIGIILSAISHVGNLQQSPSALTGVAGAIVALYGSAIVLLYVVLLFGAFALYYLIDRRNKHFRRQQKLFAAVQRYLASKLNSPSNGSVFRLGLLAEESVFDEQERSAGLWSVLYLFVNPIVALIIAHNLTQDLRRHEDRQSAYQTELVAAMSETGLQATSTPLRSHRRDPILFVVLTLITGGLFWIYWFYTLLKDYNEHFEDHVQFETGLMSLLKPQPTMRGCVTCGGSIPQTAKFCPLCGVRQQS